MSFEFSFPTSFDASFRLSFEASDERSAAPSFEMSNARSDEASFEMSDGRSSEASFRVCFLRYFPANSETSFMASSRRSFELRDWGAPGWMDTQKHGCSMKPEVSIGRRREEAAEVLLA
jgi:hypothetical protein